MSDTEEKSKRRAMEFSVSSEELILAVQNRPFLYDSTLEEFNDKKRKMVAWLEICEEVIPEWNKIKTEDSLIEFELQKKWRNLRDCYTRAYKKQMLAKAQGLKKPRAYVYYDLLSFLEPLVSKRYLAADKKTIKHGSDDDANEAEYLLNDDNFEENGQNSKNGFHEILLDNACFSPDDDSLGARPQSKLVNIKLNRNMNRKRTTPTHGRQKKRIKLDENINNLIEYMEKQSTPSKDADEMFLLAMLPHLKKIHEHKRLEMQIELMQLLKNRIDAQEYD